MSDDDFERYLAARKARGRTLLAVGVFAFVAIVAVPYGFMRAGMLRSSTFEIFVFADVVVLIGLVRATVIRFKDAVTGR